MSVADEQVAVTVRLPRSMVEQIGASADRDRRTIEDEVKALVGLALALDGEPEDLAAKAERDYAAHLSASGRKRPTTEEMWRQLHKVREEVADELYPE